MTELAEEAERADGGREAGLGAGASLSASPHPENSTDLTASPELDAAPKGSRRMDGRLDSALPTLHDVPSGLMPFDDAFMDWRVVDVDTLPSRSSTRVQETLWRGSGVSGLLIQCREWNNTMQMPPVARVLLERPALRALALALDHLRLACLVGGATRIVWTSYDLDGRRHMNGLSYQSFVIVVAPGRLRYPATAAPSRRRDASNTN